MVSGAARPDDGQILCFLLYILVIIKVFEKWYSVSKNDWDLPGSVIPTTASLLFLNPAVLYAMTIML